MKYGILPPSLRSLSRFGLIATIGLLPQLVLGQAENPRNLTHGLTQPSERVRPAFFQPGIIAEVKVKEGDVVKTGDLLARQDDYVDRKELERLDLEANSTARVDAARASMDYKNLVLKHKEDANKNGNNAFSWTEVEEARLDALTDAARLKVAEEDQAEAKIKADQQKRKVELMQLHSKVDGRVESINVSAGEMADPQHSDSVVIVTNDPLYIESRDLTTRQVAKLKIGDKLQVRYDNDSDGQWHEAEIWFIAPVATTSSDTQLIKLTMPNPEKRDTGMKVMIKLPQEVVDAAGMPNMPTARANP
jgi:multidrug efflux pump subunit AcrA (membrane-fusion protein)